MSEEKEGEAGAVHVAMALEPPDVITLVHGTFAPDASWTQEGSALREELLSSFPAAIIQEFKWSGKNSHRARIEAGTDLAKFLDGQLDDNPEARHSIIAHSHGGNVALYALRTKRVERAVRSLAFLSTPFFKCRQRNVALPLRALGPVFSWLVLFPGLPLLILPTERLLKWLLSHLISDASGSNYHFVGGLSVLLAAAMVGICAAFYVTIFRGLLSSWIAHSLPKRLNERGAKYLSLVETPTPSCRCLTIYAKRDEALLWLSSLSTAGAAPIWVSNAVQILVRRVWLPLGLLWGATALITAWRDGTAEYGAHIAFNAVVFPYMCACLCSVLLYISTYILPPIIRGRWIGFGGEALLANVLVSISPTSTLDRTVSSPETIFVVPTSRDRRGLRHSAGYSDRRAIRKIVSFLGGEGAGGGISRQVVRETHPSRPMVWAGVGALTIVASVLIYLEDRRLSNPIAATWPIFDGRKPPVLTRRLLLQVEDTIGPESSVKKPFEVNQSFVTEHCHLTGTFKSNTRPTSVMVELDDWLRISDADVRAMRSSSFLDESLKERLAPVDKSSTLVVVSNGYEFEGALNFSFDEHVFATLSMTRTAHLYFSNGNRQRPAQISLILYVDCYGE